jgi:hypothetical protein
MLYPYFGTFTTEQLDMIRENAVEVLLDNSRFDLERDHAFLTVKMVDGFLKDRS